MAMAAFPSPNPLFFSTSLLIAPPRPSPRSFPILCSKRSKKSASKTKHSKNQTPHEDFLLGGAAAGSSLTALLPRLDDEDPGLQQRQRVELQIAQAKLMQSFRQSSDSNTKQDGDELPRFNVTKNEFAESNSTVLRAVGIENQQYAEEYNDVHMGGDDEEDVGWYEEEEEEEEEERVEYWEGDLGPMTEEEEAELLREAERELAELEKNSKALNKMSFRDDLGAATAPILELRGVDGLVNPIENSNTRTYGGHMKSIGWSIPNASLAEEEEEEEEEEDEEEEEEEDRFEYWEGDLGPMTEEEEADLLREAERELAILERSRNARQKMNAGDDFGANGGIDVRDRSPLDTPKSASALAATSSSWEKRGVSGLVSPSENSPFSDANLSDAEDSSELSASNAAYMESGISDDSEDEDEDEDEDAWIARITGEIESETKRIRRGSGMPESDEKSEKRGIPAVMRCFDRAKIYVKAGNGGNGVVAFRREKYVPFGGPSGGSGGRGGNVYVEADSSVNSLLSFRKSVHFRAGRGSHGQGKSQDGATGFDCTVKVPIGTVVREAGEDLSGSGNILLELTTPGQRELLLPGGRGGRGNTAFKTGRNKTPQLAENGEEGAEMWLELELKLVADVGIIGVPNAGKSTLLSAISAAQPAIAAYPFTTLLPNLGVVPLGFEASMVVADLPGLLEGAHLGIGLGHEFLRHTERCRVLVHVVDGMSQQPEQEYEAVRLELELFNPALSDKPFIVAFNKMDIPEAAERWKKFQVYLQQKGVEPTCMSAATKMGTSEVVHKAYNILQSQPRSTNVVYNADKESQVGEMVRKQRSTPIEHFEIFGDVESRTWQVQGAGLERFTQMTNWEYFEALKRFQHVLSASGVNKALREHGVQEGDTVIVGEMEFVWHNSEDVLASGDWKRGFRGSKRWPH